MELGEDGTPINEEDNQADDIEVVAVPNFLANHTVLDQLQNQLQGNEQNAPEQSPSEPQQAHDQMGDIRHTPIDQFNQGQALLSWAFPTLYPYRKADIMRRCSVFRQSAALSDTSSSYSWGWSPFHILPVVVRGILQLPILSNARLPVVQEIYVTVAQKR